MEEVMHTFDRFFFAFRRFPAIKNLVIIPTGEYLILSSHNIIQLSELYKKLSYGCTIGLVCVQFLAALSIHLGGDKTVSKDPINKFFHNLSMRALSKSDDSILLKFDAINRLNKNKNSLLVNKTPAYENAEIEKLQNFFDPRTVAGNELTINNKIESTIVKGILKYEKPPCDVDGSDIRIAKVTEEIEQENIIQNVIFPETELKKDKRVFETVNNLVKEGTYKLI